MDASISKPNCNCAKSFNVVLARKDDYDVFKKFMNKGRHPAFIGRETFKRNSENGGALFYEFENEISAVTLVNPRRGVLLALNVAPKHRGHGLGVTVVDFLMPNFARVLESKVPWFEKRNYVSIGKIKKGRSLNTQIMIRKNLLSLAGNLKKAWNV